MAKGKKGKQAKAIPVKVVCLHCAKSFETSIIKVTDTPGTPAVTHYEQVKGGPDDGGDKTLFDGDKGK